MAVSQSKITKDEQRFVNTFLVAVSYKAMKI